MSEGRAAFGGRILVVDDSPADLRLLCELLTHRGYVVYPASSGELGLRFVESTRPDLVLLDVETPDPDGYEVCRRLKAVEATRHIPVIFVSSTDHLANRLRAFAAGGVDYIVKPFQPDEILARVESHLSLRGWQQVLEERVRERTADLIRANDRLREEASERQATEATLRESQERYRMLTEMLPEAVVVHADGKVVYVNPAGLKLFGADDAATWADVDVMERVHPAFRALAAERIRLSYEDREPADRLEEVFLRIDGTPFDVETTTAPILYRGNPATVTVITDVTERKRAEAALRESEERYRRITETITDYVFRVEVQDGRAIGTIHGPGCVAVTGYSPEELARDRGLWLSMVVPDDHAAVIEQARAVLAGERFVPIEHRIVRKDRAVRWVRNTPVPQYGADGSLVAYDGLIQDITERRILQEQLFQAQKMESIGRLAGGVAHDFNNLLTAVLGYLELAYIDLPADLPADHPLRADLDEILRAGEGAASLTRQLLSFASRQPVAPVRLNLSAVVADSLKMLGRLLGEDIVIATELGPALGPVEADPGQIQQLLVNLAVNARDAMPEGGRLVIETANETIDEAYAATHPELSPWQYVRLSVTDTGVGMSEEVLAHLFEPFFTTKELGKGTGLGLATCHGIVRQIGGEISVDSKAGQGTTFRILLPQVEGIASEERAGVATSPTPTGTETVLVVEDEPAVRRLAVLGLRAQGYTVFEAADGEEALHVVAHLVPRLDLLVSDVVMPGVSGPGLAERLLQLHPETKLVLMSGHAEATILPPALGMRGIPFLPKPFTPERLARKVREVLDAPPTP